MQLIKGKVWKLGDNIDTDLIVPGRYLDADMEEIKKHVFESSLPEFAGGVSKGDIIVGGSNFGCGSSRENAPAALKALGVGCIAAESFGRIFFRNAIAIGLPLIQVNHVSQGFEADDTAEIDLKDARISNLSKNTITAGEPLSPEMLKILEAGGILELLKPQENET